jgi:hypothetical protein
MEHNDLIRLRESVHSYNPNRDLTSILFPDCVIRHGTAENRKPLSEIVEFIQISINRNSE